jgi:hypothetical protein
LDVTGSVDSTFADGDQGYIGARVEALEYFDGTIDEIAIFNRSLSPEEIEQLYNNGIGRPIDSSWFNTTGLIGLWHFDLDGNDNSTTAYDSSGNGNNGTINEAWHTDGKIVPNAEANNVIWFATQENITAGGSDSNYYLYYGNPAAGAPKANGSEVYLFYDDFEDGVFTDKWTAFTGSPIESGGYITLGQDVAIYVNLSNYGLNLGEGFKINFKGWLDLGYQKERFAGAVVYKGIPVLGGDLVDTAPRSNFVWYAYDATGSPRMEAYLDSIHNSFYLKQPITIQQWHDFAITRFPNGTWQGEFDGEKTIVTTWTSTNEVAYYLTFGDWEDAQWGGWHRIDDVKVRKYISPEPTAGLLDEEALEAVERVNITIISPYKTYNITFIGSLPPGEKIIIYGSGFSPNGTVIGRMPVVLPGKSIVLRFGTDFSWTIRYYEFWEVI